MSESSTERPWLARALDFTPADLDANRAGRLSDLQAARIRQGAARTRLITVSAVIGLTLAATLAIFLGQQNDSALSTFAGITLAVINAAVVAIGAWHYLRLARDFNNGQVLTLTGAVTRTVRLNGRAVSYVLGVGDQRLVVTKDAFNAFEEGRAYRVYLSASARRVLAAESV